MLLKAKTQAGLVPGRLNGAICRDPGWIQQEPEPPVPDLPSVLQLPDLSVTHHKHSSSAQLRDQAGQKTQDPGGDWQEGSQQKNARLRTPGATVQPARLAGAWPPAAGLSLASWKTRTSGSWDSARLTEGIVCPGPRAPFNLEPVQKARPRGPRGHRSGGSERSLGSSLCDPANPG